MNRLVALAFFSLHFQFVMANERPAPYDLFMIVGGHFSLALRATMPEPMGARVLINNWY